MATVVFCENIIDTVVQVSCTVASLGCMTSCSLMGASPSGIHKTALRVQTLASHGTTITWITLPTVIYTSSSTRFARSATSPSFASASTAAPRLLALFPGRPRGLGTRLPDCMHPLAPPAGFQSNVLKHS